MELLIPLVIRFNMIIRLDLELIDFETLKEAVRKCTEWEDQGADIDALIDWSTNELILEKI